MFYDQFLLFCDAKSVSRTKACVDCGISRTAWHKWEDGAVPNGATLNKLAGYFGVSVNELLGAHEQQENPATVSDEVKIAASKYDLLNDANKAFIDEMIEKLIKSQSAE